MIKINKIFEDKDNKYKYPDIEIIKEFFSKDEIDNITLDVPLFIRLLEYAKEDAKTDMDLHKVAENIIELSKTNSILNMDLYTEIIPENNTEITTTKPNTIMKENKVRDFIKEALKKHFEKITEAEKEEDTETTETTDDVENVDDIEDINPEDIEDTNLEDIDNDGEDIDMGGTELSGETKEIQQGLEQALKAARSLGDEKLAHQIGNSITFFTRSHIVKNNIENIQEVKRFQKLAGIKTNITYSA
jgi:hypothetical protein